MNKFTYIIIEDEDPAADRMVRLLSELVPDSECQSRLVSIKSSVDWLSGHVHPDLIFMDIQLADGNSFEIFKKIKPDCPVIFTTAYDNYAIEAFKVNSIDYLLKPVKKEELRNALDKFQKQRYIQGNSGIDFDRLIKTIVSQDHFQKRLLIRFGDVIKAIEISDAAYFYTENKINYVCTFDGRNYPVDMNLDELEKAIDPSVFFRINRQFIVNVKAITKMVAWSKSRVKLELNPKTEIETVVSTERSPLFKTWLTGS